MIIGLTIWTFLVISCSLAPVHSSFWSFSDPFEDFFNPTTIAIKQSTPKTPLPASVDTKSNAADLEGIRKLIDDELNKYKASSGISTNTEAKGSVATATTTESESDMIRRIIAEELAKVLPTAASTSAPVQISTKAVPIWQSWVKTKKWAKKPGPDGQAPPGFVGSLQSRFGSGGVEDSAAHPTGSPGWVWSKISSKWADKTTTVKPIVKIMIVDGMEAAFPPESV